MLLRQLLHKLHDKEVVQFIRKHLPLDVEATIARSGHIKVMLPSDPRPFILPRSPSDRRWTKNARKDLRKRLCPSLPPPN